MTVVDHVTGEIVQSLDQLEAIIERGLTTYIEVGFALLEIRDGKKYRDAGFPTWEHYCQKRWNWSTRHAGRMMSAAGIAGELASAPETGPIGPILPTVESQVRPLSALDTAEQRAEAWAAAVESAGGEQPTAAQVQAAGPGFEAKSRTVDGEHRVYARFVGVSA